MDKMTNEELVEALSIGLKTIFDAPIEYRVNVIATTNDIKKELLSRLNAGEKAIEKLERIKSANVYEGWFLSTLDKILAEEG